MGKVDDMRAWNEWREYHRALKRDKAVDKLSPVERMRRLEKLEKDPVSWMLFFFAEYTRHPFTSFQKKAIRRITSNPEWYEVLSWSRELAKSTIVFICIMYLVLTKLQNLLLFGNVPGGGIEPPQTTVRDYSMAANESGNVCFTPLSSL